MSRYFILFMIMLQCSLIYAQDVQPVDPAKEIEDLNKEISSLKKDTTNLNNDIRKLNADIDAKNKELQKNKEKYEASANYAKIEELDSIKKKRDEEIKRLSGIISMQEDSIVNKTGTKQLARELKQLQEESQALIAFADDTRKRILAEIDSIIKVPYLQVSLDDINALIDECNLYLGDNELDIKASKLKATRELKKTIDEKAMVIYRPYDEKASRRAIKDLYDLKSFIKTSTQNNDKPENDLQWEEIEGLIRDIELYPTAIEDFIRLIDQVEDKRGPWDYNSASMCQEDVDNVVNAFGVDGLDNINRIPYLREKYTQYKTATHTNPFDKQVFTIENEMKSYLPKPEPPEEAAIEMTVQDEKMSIEDINNFIPTIDPETNADDPEANADEPETNADEPEANADEPEAKADEPEANADEPEAKADEPEAEKAKVNELSKKILNKISTKKK